MLLTVFAFLPRLKTCRCAHAERSRNGILRTISFAKGGTDEGLDVLTPIVVEGELVIRRYPARGEFPAVVELQVREARR